METTTHAAQKTVEANDRSERISEQVVTAVAAAKGVDPLDLDPLFDVVDPDALNSIFHPTVGSPPTSVEIRFSMSGCQVLIQGEGEVTVIQSTEIEDESPSTSNEV